MDATTPMSSSSDRPIWSRQSGTPSRRKVRKGTHSCWECKRRKIKCIFSSSNDEVCVHCRRRGTTCVTQDLPEAVGSANNNRGELGNRIDRVENALYNLTQMLGKGTSHHDSPSNLNNNSEGVNASPREEAPMGAASSYPTPISVNSERVARPENPRQPQSKHETISAALLAAFPSDEDTEKLLVSSRKVLDCCHVTLVERASSLTKERYESIPSVQPRPDVRTHPVLLARFMLAVSLYFLNPWFHSECQFSEHPRVIMKRFANTAIDLVTRNDSLHGSIESLQCLMLEVRYHHNLGNLRQAWLVNRRAISLGQLMGVHRYPNQPLKVLDPSHICHPDAMWFRMVAQDRHLCLLLGAPPGTHDSLNPSEATILPSEPIEWKLERMLVTISAQVIERNQSGVASFNQDLSIDSELLRISQSLPEDFWRPPSVHSVSLGSYADAMEGQRLQVQLLYYQLLNQLHLPYMLSYFRCGLPSRGGTHEHEQYSTTTCANASREMLGRYITYRNFNYMSLCFRNVDFIAFTAALTLLLAHLDSNLASQKGVSSQGMMNSLTHQRPSDRALLIEVIKTVDNVSEYNGDEMHIDATKMLRRLLKVEADAARGSQYNMTATMAESDEAGGEPSGSGEQDGEGLVLQVPIPYYGKICITRTGSISKVFRDENGQPRTLHDRVQGTSTPAGMQILHCGPDGEVSRTNGRADYAQPNMTSHTLGSQFNGLGGEHSNFQRVLDDSDLGITAGMDGWALQGVDLAFFDSITMGGPSATVSQVAPPNRL